MWWSEVAFASICSSATQRCHLSTVPSAQCVYSMAGWYQACMSSNSRRHRDRTISWFPNATWLINRIAQITGSAGFCFCSTGAPGWVQGYDVVCQVAAGTRLG